MKTRTILLAALALSSTLALACSKKDPPASTQAPDAAPTVITVSLAPPDAGADSGAPTGPLKNYFPQDGTGGYKRVHRAAREGYAEAGLEKDGKEVATLSISDAERMTYVKAKFENSTEKLEGFPLMTVGKDLSTILVKDRFQVKVLSKTLDPEARKAILASFDLKGLAL
jgi:hypothetical protein